MNATCRLFAGALALGVAVPAAAAAMTSALPEPETQNGITYLSGGIGRTEAQAMKEEARLYPLSMTFSANKDNEFLANVRVTIKKPSGKMVLSTLSPGPIMLIRLPAGKYVVAARANGKTYRHSVEVKAKGDTPLRFHWPHA